MNTPAMPLFFDLHESELDILLSGGLKKSYPKNTVVISEGDSSHSFYMINSGKVKVFLDDEQGKEIVLSILGPGEYFGEMSLIDDEVRSAGVMVLEDAHLTIISMRNFRSCLEKHPKIATRVMLELTKRLRDANKKIGSLALLDVYGRVANALLQLARKRDEKLVIEEKLTHQDIANMVGASREMVTRILRDLAADGYICIEKGKGIILNEKM
ncbi:MAG TPA: cyclic nucleotide-binding domain-containing protein [Gallionella sp.]|nr:cyclic nucleotide-binding domain-containing protein [Gallionella sp.]